MSATKSKRINSKIYESNQISQVLKYNPSLLTNCSTNSSGTNKIGFKIVKIEKHSNKNATYL